MQSSSSSGKVPADSNSFLESPSSEDGGIQKTNKQTKKQTHQLDNSRVLYVNSCVSMCIVCSSSSFSSLGRRGLLQVGNQVGSLLAPPDACKDHLGSGDVLPGVLQVHVQGLLVPGDTLTHTRMGVNSMR